MVIGISKYTPDPLVRLVMRVNLPAMLLLAAYALWIGHQLLRHAHAAASWLFFLISLPAFAGFLIFTIVLHKEYFPERIKLSLQLLILPVFLAVVMFLFFGGASKGFWYMAGTLIFSGLELALIVIFSAGTHLTAEDPNSPPGESRPHWRTIGHSLWFDPDYPSMTRWAVGGFLLLPGLVSATVQNYILWRYLMAPSGGCVWVVGMPIWLLSLFLVCRLYFHQLIGLAAEGRIFGPGNKAFE